MGMTMWKKKKAKNPNPYVGVGSVGAHGTVSEKRIVRDMGGEQTIGSGAFNGHKSDGLLSVGDMDFRIECKATRKESMILKREWLAKIRREAIETGKIPLLTVSFTRGDGSPRPAGDWVMMPMSLFKDISDEN